MVGVFVAFIRVVYGRMIYMSLPIYNSKNVNRTHIMQFFRKFIKIFIQQRS